MKAASSKSESKKRKRDDSQEPITESPKKAKVHAQRKFAQGAAFNSPVITPIKDKVRPPASVSSSGPVLTGKCPNTEDFLTFLCFRRTSILPPKLDFFKDAVGSEVESSASTEKSNHKSSDQTPKQVGKKGDKSDDTKKSQMPAVQALRKKYQEQRLAKQKPTNVTRLAQKVKGKNMVRTRSSAVVEQTKTVAKKEKESKVAASALRSGLKRVQPSGKPGRKGLKPKNLRAGLRSGGSVGETPTKVTTAKKTEKEGKKTKVEVEAKTKGKRAKRTEGFSDFSSDDNEPLLAVKKPKTMGAKGGGRPAVKTRSKGTSGASETETGRTTKTLVRPTRKTKEAAALYMEMITKKLVSPEKSGDDDLSSVDSFPELPNAKRTEQRESEIKSKALTPKKSEPKQEEKTKETKKQTVKKSEQTNKKIEPKIVKNESGKKVNLKKETKPKVENAKEEINTVKRSSRGSAKEEKEPTKTKQQEEEKSEQSRPSTRSRQQEIASPLKKPPRKIMAKKKESQQKDGEKKSAEVDKKVKGNKDENVKSAQKSKITQNEVPDSAKKNQKDSSQENHSKKEISEAVEKSGKQEETKVTRKTGEKKLLEKKEVEKKEKEKEKEKDKVKEKEKEKVKEKEKEKVKEKEKEKEKPKEKEKEKIKEKEAEKLKEKVKEKETEKVKDKEKIREKETEKVKDKEKIREKETEKVKDKEKIREKETEKVKEKTVETVRKGRKPMKSPEETETKKIKIEKKTEKKAKKEEEREKEKEEVNVNKRPTRKCSTADKIWIDIDGFTSDEDDFLEMSTISKTKAPTKNDSEKPINQKPETDNKKSNKTDHVVSNKNKSEKTSERKTETKKVETKKGKSEKKLAEEVTNKSQVENKKGGIKPGKDDGNSGKTGEQKEERKKKTEAKPGDVKKSEETVKDSNEKEEKIKAKAKVKEKDKEKDKEKKGDKMEENKKVGRKKLRNTKKEEKDEEEEEKGEDKGKEKEEEQPQKGKRTRPVRQCSIGEKRWIETDSDSFSFYETSDDEDNLPIVDFGKKSSPDTKENKNEDVRKTEKKEEDNFSESDEEPLKKKSLSTTGETEQTERKQELKPESKQPEVKQPDIKQPETKQPEVKQSEVKHLDVKQQEVKQSAVKEAEIKVPEVKAPAKIQRELPALTPLKSTEANQTNIPILSKPEAVVIPAEPQPLLFLPAMPERPSFLPEPSPVSVPNRIEMILHSLKRDKMAECGPSHGNDVKVTFAKVPCSYQVKATFPSPREPISTHGLDLLSEVALPTTPKEHCQTKRIEKWLNDSLAVEQKPRFQGYDSGEYKSVEKADTGFYFGKPSPPKVGFSSHSEFQKFGQLDLLESQKLLKKNLLAAEMKQDAASKSQDQQHQSTPKKALTSVQDLLKLQKERREISKAVDNSPHLKNCKCNNCVVKKGWFKNKPVPKTEQHKSSAVEESDESPKPFESLTKAFIGEGKNSKMAVSVAPMVVSPSSSKDSGERKGIFQQRKLSFLERMKERERKEAAAKSSSNPFSPNNESSVYAFEPEPEQSVGTNTPFRSKTRESRTSSTSRSDDEGTKMSEDDSVTTQKIALDKAAKAAFQSASIAVQVNLDSETVAEVEPLPELQDGKSIEISTQTEVPEEDSDSPMFYIPLQQATATGASASSDQQLIQGVALKLGTEGPMGPNQRVIMKAKLVTKPPDSPSIKAVVMPQPKRLFDQKYNNPPIGTVQPTTRKPPDEPVADKPESAKPVIPSAKDAPETIPPPAESEGSKAGKSTPPKALKGKEKPQRQESIEDQASSSKAKKPNKQPKSSEPVISPSNSTWLPPGGTPSKLVEAPTFHPTEKDFQDPFEFFDRIRPAAEKFGLCRIVPPSNFKPDCKVSDDMRFTAYNQYVHRMFHRWGPNIKEMMAIKKYLATQSISLKQPPWIGGIEVDLPRLYQSVQNCGGLMKVMEKKKWHQVADMMKIPKAAQDRVTKLDDIYCKYLLPYDTLSHDERQKLFDEVEKDWAERQKAAAETSETTEEEEGEENYIEECEECVVKGRNMALNQFYRIARNTMSMWFRNAEPSPREVESEFWRHVSERNHHVCVHSGSIDSSGWGYGFPIAKNNSFSKHPWNLKVLTNNSGSVLRYLGPVMGVTVPTLHVGMVFTAFCWYRDPHGLPWIEYLHTGAPKIWYGISDDNSTVFQEALAKLLPRYIKNKTIWLPSDTAMIPPELLVEHGVSLCHTVQEPGQFILVFPRAFTSSICTGYLVSESVYFAQLSWLATAEQVFKDIQESCEPSMFSLEKLLFSIATDSRSSADVLKQVLPMVWHVRQKEIDGRKTLFNLGLKSSERLPAKEPGSKKKKGRWAQEEDGDYECEICRTNLYVSLVTNSQEEGVYCLPHAIDLLTQKRHQLKYCKLMYTYTQEEMNEMVEKLEQRIENKNQKKLPSKPSTSTK